ncbi:MAG: baseplate assembly protein [Salinicola sp.]|uniref:phage baseplate assembly protein V n=1 Tax=uncultured Salinicola sp. TaxID=1193542 RepID=UPI000C97F8AA|nr:phage baseplate assembly protein V [uncultured Salinicola sp.]MAM57368.1 baseplate assembly protein [Salinicola sp.]
MNNAAELLRLIHNLVRLGTIAEVDHQAARVRVKSGDMLTTWLQWLTLRAGTTLDWDPPTIGEQVILFSPGGDPASGVALTGLFSTAHPAPTNAPTLWRRVFPDGAVIEYDHGASHLAATLPGSASIYAQADVTVTTASALTATAAGGATINANVVINGNVTLNGNLSQPSGKTATMSGAVHFKGAVTSNGKDISSSHTHDGVQRGGDKTEGVS